MNSRYIKNISDALNHLPQPMGTVAEWYFGDELP